MRIKRVVGLVGLVVAALLLSPTMAASVEPIDRPSSAGFALRSENPHLVFVSAEMEVPTLDCETTQLLLTLPSRVVAKAEPRLGIWVGLRSNPLTSPGDGLRAGLVATCTAGRPHYALALQLARTVQWGQAPERHLTTLIDQPALEPGDRVLVVVHPREGQRDQFDASWRSVTDKSANFWSRQIPFPRQTKAATTSPTTECVLELLQTPGTGPVRRMAGSVYVDWCSAMTFSKGAIKISDVATGARSTLPLDGSPSSRHKSTVLEIAADSAATSTRWLATPRLLPLDHGWPVDRPRPFEVSYEILR
jgi:hypothetical protein